MEISIPCLGRAIFCCLALSACSYSTSEARPGGGDEDGGRRGSPDAGSDFGAVGIAMAGVCAGSSVPCTAPGETVVAPENRDDVCAPQEIAAADIVWSTELGDI